VLGGVPGPAGQAEVARGFTLLKALDLATMWGLLVVGLCLIGGLFTRLSCVLAAGFLLMTYLVAPPFPWYTAPPASEGNYLFVNKNVIEMLALLTLATTPSGLWLGVDAWLAGIFGRRQPRPKAAAAK